MDLQVNSIWSTCPSCEVIPTLYSCPPHRFIRHYQRADAKLHRRSINSNTAAPLRWQTSKSSCRPVAAQGSIDAGETGFFPPLFQPPGKEGLIFSAGEKEAWDSGGVGGAVVRRYLSDNEERWCMWYQGYPLDPQPDTSSLALLPSTSAKDVGVPPDDTPASPELNLQLESDKQKALLGAALCGVAPCSTGLALSANGILWSRGTNKAETDARGEGGGGTVLAQNQNWWSFDTCHVSISEVIMMDSQKVRGNGGVYWMYYSGGDREDVSVPEPMTRLGLGIGSEVGPGLGPKPGELVEGLRMRPGLALSNDGRNWARIEGDHHTGALFDVGEAGDWDSLFIGAPQVVFVAPGDIRMYYHSFSLQTGFFTTGFARSKDGIKWIKFGKCMGGGERGAFDELGVASRHVVVNSSGVGFSMVYEGVDVKGRRSIGLAKSEVGLWEWDRCGQVFGPSEVEGSWDCESVGSPCLVEMGGGEWRLYYVGVGADGRQGIGMAQTSNDDFTRFKRWRNPMTNEPPPDF